MGCDIHIVIEQKYGSNWIGIINSESIPYGTLDPDPTMRNYQFFAALAGVRGDGPEPKGIPEDASGLSRMYIEGRDKDGHSHSYMPLKDFISTWLSVHDDVLPIVTKEKLRGDTYRAEYNKVVRGLSMNTIWTYESEKIDDIRVVFWFDN